jgi:hypothetical protein
MKQKSQAPSLATFSSETWISQQSWTTSRLQVVHSAPCPSAVRYLVVRPTDIHAGTYPIFSSVRALRCPSETPALKVSKPRRSLEDKIWWENMRKWYEYSQDGPMTSSPYHHSWHVYYKYVLLIQYSLLVNECPSPIDTKKITSREYLQGTIGWYLVKRTLFCCWKTVLLLRVARRNVFKNNLFVDSSTVIISDSYPPRVSPYYAWWTSINLGLIY